MTPLGIAVFVLIVAAGIAAWDGEASAYGWVVGAAIGLLALRALGLARMLRWAAFAVALLAAAWLGRTLGGWWVHR